ncbi:MAG: UDP-N-acetylmuramoyl-L-alanine--D-glutamate ligase [Treponema sp.]|nr:UDP-N-acetylmuramoyl-L-alanine--D-glutamate ligase [Treponema sp.]
MAHNYPKGCYFKSLEDIKNKNITVMGLGLNGGGEASVRFFLKHGANVLVTDMKTQEQLKKSVDALINDKSLDTSKLRFRLGEHNLEDFLNADCVIKNPGVKYEGNKYLEVSKNIETDLSIFLNFTNAPIIAVTGSKGKSSTVSAIYYGLKTAGFTTFLGGNITVSPLSFLEKTTKDTPVVIEFSSWQLADLRGRGLLKPHISLITKIVPDHQNWYNGMEPYVNDKKIIYATQDNGCYSIFDYGEDEPGTGPSGSSTWGDEFSTESKATVLRYYNKKLPKGSYGVWQEKDENGKFKGKVLLPGMKEPETILEELSVPGEHMKTNVLNAALVMYLMGLPGSLTKKILKNFPGVEHRLQFFFEKQINNIKYRFFNDTCATVPDAVVAACNSFDTPVILITGGTDKGLDFKKLTDYLNTKINNIKDIYFLSGTGTDKIISELKNKEMLYIEPFNNLDSLISKLKENIKCNDNYSTQITPIVFSPGATSFGMFQNEFDRGNQFMEKIIKEFSKE